MQTWTGEGGGEIFTVTTPPLLVGTAHYTAWVYIPTYSAGGNFLDVNFGGDLEWVGGQWTLNILYTIYYIL